MQLRKTYSNRDSKPVFVWKIFVIFSKCILLSIIFGFIYIYEVIPHFLVLEICRVTPAYFCFQLKDLVKQIDIWLWFDYLTLLCIPTFRFT